MQKNKLIPYIIDVYPDKAQYLSDEKIKIYIETFNPSEEEIKAVIKIKVMLLNVQILEKSLIINIEAQSIRNDVVLFDGMNSEWQGYGVDVSILIDNKEVDILSTAFDVVCVWNKAPRYGFLSDFYREDEDDYKDVEQMRKYHLNVVQFYDWMYRHDNLIPDKDYFIDPLSRELSLKAVKDKIKFCHKYGMKALAYGAVYAASREFYEKNKELALYDNAGNVENLGDGWLSIMNISKESPWSKHIINEFKKSIEVLDFDGIHMDTYGFPKTAYSMLNGEKKLERLNEHYPIFINNTREELENVKEDIALIFNAVSSWSIETVATAKQDAVYIEVWEPCERYIHLYHLIDRAKELGGKSVILAAYLSAFLKENNIKPEYAENSFLLTSAVIFASGGYQLLLGENNGILAHPYYVEHGIIRDQFERIVRNYYDFIVRYSNLLYDLKLVDVSMTHANGINEEYVFENAIFSSYGEPDKVWTIVKEMPGYKTINLINLTGIKSDIWNESKGKRPEVVENICIKALIDEKVKGVYLASPDMNNGMTSEINFEYEAHKRGMAVKFIIPKLEVWDMIYIKVNANVR